MFKNKYFRILILVVFWIFIANEFYSIYVDVYNFGQLEKAKVILEQLPKNAKGFYSLKEFNEAYKMNTRTIKNCYHISNFNGSQPYVFGFKLESLLYRLIYQTIYYAYPKYDFPYRQMCVSGRGCYDGAKDAYIYIISHPCKNKEE